VTTEAATVSNEPSTTRRPARSVLIGQLAFLGVGIYVLIYSADLGLWTTLGPGPGLFPFAMGALLTAMSLVWMVQEWRNPSTPRDEAEPSQVVAVVGSLLILACVLPFLGFQISLLVFLLYHLRFRAHLSWLWSAVIAVIGSVGVFYLFTVGLKVSLPTASLPPFSLIGL